MSWRIILILLSSCALARADVEFFEKRVRPILVEHCYSCHSAEAEKLKGGLRLDSREGVRKGGESKKAAIVPGEPEKSLLIEAVRYENSDLAMPPKKKLSDAAIADLVAWVKMGAPDPRDEAAKVVKVQIDGSKHWAFQPVRDVAGSSVDQFIDAKLPADKRTLIRRAYFDLWGLPPTYEEVAGFEKDHSPDAFAKVIDRLLASPRYGERWGRYWLDLARYADTKGYVYGDREEARFVHSHNYRDWVIHAFNQDMPYDRFITLQIAADQVDCRREDLAAMGFLTVGRRFLGVVHDIIDDRIDTLTRTTQALSVGCARCHDHKFDPIPTQDYYSLYGVFAGTFEKIAPLSENDRHAQFDAELKKRIDQRDEAFAKKCEEVADRVRAKSVDYLLAALEAEKLPDELFYEIQNADDLNIRIVRQWYQYLLGQKDSRIWGAWHRLAKLKPAEFTGALASSRPIHPLVASAIKNAKSMKDVARAYGELFASVEKEWKELRKKDAKATALTDDDREELRQVLYVENSPVRVPNGAISDLEHFFDEGGRVSLSKGQMEIDKWLIEGKDPRPYTVVLEDRPRQENARVFKRGNPAMRGEEVPRRYLEIIAGSARKNFTHGSGRLDLAKAIVDPANPLTARVMVNRVWAWHFGEGLVKTPSDFGLRAEAPTHPELLDWLASRFMREGWSMKKLHRTIMLSRAYQQASEPRRLDFEAMRDSLLTASGEMDMAMGGRPVEMFSPPSAKRRSVYGRVDRQFLPGTFRVFDFASPDLHTPERIDTTVPQQALFMMNSPFVIERARALANRKDVAAIAEPEQRVRRMYQIVYQREPTAKQISAALAYLAAAKNDAAPEIPPKPLSAEWQYGYGEFDNATGRIKAFAKLPHFAGEAWQGGPSWPDEKLGWAQLTASGGHAGNDLAHAVIRRWVSPREGNVNISGTVAHPHREGHGVIARIVHSRRGQLAMWQLHDTTAKAEIGPIAVKPGDAIDFVVSINTSLNNNDFAWSPVIKMEDRTWDAKKDFGGLAKPAKPMDEWEKYAQVLLLANEFVFVD